MNRAGVSHCRRASATAAGSTGTSQAATRSSPNRRGLAGSKVLSSPGGSGFIVRSITQSPDKRVLPLFVRSFQVEFTINVPAILGAVVLSTLPILALYAIGRRQLLSGLTAGFGE